jgi:hypothetical protein
MGQVFGALPFRPVEHPRAEGLSQLKADASGTSMMAGIDPLQFGVFSLVSEDGGLVVRDPHFIEPSLTGDEPDVETRIQLAAFNAPNFGNEGYTGATLRLDIGQDELSDSPLRPVFWSIAAALDLAKSQSGEARNNDYRLDFSSALNNRPVSIPGGLAELRFEVVANKPKPWWREIFSFGASDAGSALATAIGFPMVGPAALKLLDQAFDELIDNAEPLFRSRPIRFAMSAKAKEDFTGNVPGFELPALNPGFHVLARSQDFSVISAQKAKFLAGYGVLVPSDMSLQDLHSGANHALSNIPYAVIRVQSRNVNLGTF